jgi:formyltetrahydrofolate synthetase
MALKLADYVVTEAGFGQKWVQKNFSHLMQGRRFNSIGRCDSG